MRTRVLALIPAAVVAAAAFVPAGTAAGGPSPGISNGGDGIVSPSGLVRYVAVTSGRDTLVEKIGTGRGRVLAWSTVPGFYGIPVVSGDGTPTGLTRDGTRLVLSTYPGSGTFTRLVVVDTSSLRVLRRLALRGAWSVDALSPDGGTLYLIQYLPTGSYAHYRVRAYEWASAHLVPGAIADKTEPGPMIGSPLRRRTSADGSWAYTLYVRPGGTAFVHALDTVHRSARCVDLPWRTWSGLSSTVRLRLRRGGRQLVVDPYGGTLPAAVVDTRTFRVTVSKPA